MLSVPSTSSALEVRPAIAPSSRTVCLIVTEMFGLEATELMLIEPLTFETSM